MAGRAVVGLGVVAALLLTTATGYILSPPAASPVVDATGRPVAGATVTLGAGRLPGRGLNLPLPSRSPFGTVRVTAPGYLDGAGRPGQTIVLHRRPRLFGRMLDETGSGVDHAVVSVSVAGRTWEVVTDDAGFFAMDVPLDPGAGYLVATAFGHDAYAGFVDLEADHFAQVFGVMTRQIGTLLITSEPSGAVVSMDGAPLTGCPATPCSRPVAVGTHTLVIGGDLYVPATQQVTVLEGGEVAIPVTLQRKTGSLNVSAPAGAGAALLVDGQPVGSLSWRGTLPTGTHSIAYSADDHWPAATTVNVEWNQTTTVAVSSAAVTAGDAAGFQAGLAQYLSSLPGQFSAWISPVAGGQEIGYQPTTEMEAASVIKLPLALYMEKSAQDGTIRMGDPVALEDGDFMGGTGTLDGSAHSGDQFSYHDLLALLVQQSDNTAWQALDRVLGQAQVDAYSASVGAPDCHQVDDGCTAREAGLMLQKLAAGQLLDPAHTADLLGLLESTAFNDRINYYLGGYLVAHKVGMDGSVMNDSGIVYGAHPFVVSMFTNADPGTGVEAIRQVSRLAARLYR